MSWVKFLWRGSIKRLMTVQMSETNLVRLHIVVL